MSKIEWTQQTWNPVTGCDKVSPGCKNCYAEVMHRRLQGMFPDKYSKPFRGNVQIHPDEFNKPLLRAKPTLWFVCSMSDLFHKDVTFLSIDMIFNVMQRCPWHTFQVLTKRADRMLSYLMDRNDRGLQWPPNVWTGISCENQQYFEERAQYLIRIPAAVRFLSCEPLLGRLDLSAWLALGGIHWVIAGGESGRNARPMHPDWLRSIRDQCEAHNVPFFFKQWGEYVPAEYKHHKLLYFPHSNNSVTLHVSDTDNYKHKFMPDSDAADYCAEHEEEACSFLRVGKSNAGSHLDGKQYLQMPQLNSNP